MRFAIENGNGTGLDVDDHGQQPSLAVDSTVDQTLEVKFQHLQGADPNRSARCLAVHLEQV